MHVQYIEVISKCPGQSHYLLLFSASGCTKGTEGEKSTCRKRKKTTPSGLFKSCNTYTLILSL